jgi:phosphatidylserine synthase
MRDVPFLLRAAIPNLITAAGLLCAIMGVIVGLHFGWPWLLVSFALDILDGWSAPSCSGRAAASIRSV